MHEFINQLFKLVIGLQIQNQTHAARENGPRSDRSRPQQRRGIRRGRRREHNDRVSVRSARKVLVPRNAKQTGQIGPLVAFAIVPGVPRLQAIGDGAERGQQLSDAR